jgi:nucleotide-binding universal stress UspA family protein
MTVSNDMSTRTAQQLSVQSAVEDPAGGDELRISARVQCSDGLCGKVIGVVVDPRRWVVSHLMVEPVHRSGLGRLVPLDLIDSITDEIRLTCNLDEFEHLARGERTGLLPGSNGGYGGYGLGQAVPGPYIGRSSFGVLGGGANDAFDPVVYDTLPAGEVAVQDGAVHATDGEIGHLEGLVADRSHHVTHVVLREGHLWGRRRVAIPIGAVATVEGDLQLSITKQQVEDLPTLGAHPVTASVTTAGATLPVTADQSSDVTPSSRAAGAAADTLDPASPVIVVGVDGSDESKDALRWATRQAELTGSALRIVTSWHFPTMAYGGGMPLPGTFDMAGASQQIATQAIKEALGDHPDVHVSSVVIEGTPALELLREAESADLLVIGSRGHGAFAGMLLGSVSEYCVAHSACPVVVVRHGMPTA